MKINIIKPLFLLLFLVFLVACSTKKDTFVARNSHALSTKYNILYNGGVGFDKGLKAIQANERDNFWELLPPEKMQIKEEVLLDAKPNNKDFELAETKATKAIQKHSMNIGGKEKNSQIDEAYLMLGKARYYDQRFVPALDAFNYILYKYPNSSKIYEAKIWREKTNMRLGNDALVIKNISKLLQEQKLKKQILADANALLATSFLNIEEKDSAVAKLKLAVKFTRVNQEKARYRYILGQLYQELGYKDSAVAQYESVIKMNRKADRAFVMQAHAKKAELFDYQNGDFVSFEKTFNKLIKDRENRPYKDLIFYHFAVFQDQQNNQKKAIDFYNASLRTNSKDTYLVASNYRNLGNRYFKEASYWQAAKYYDSTLVNLNTKSREFIKIKKIRSNLDEVILYEALAKTNDSILNVLALSTADRATYFENYIAKLQRKEQIKSLLQEKNKTIQQNRQRNNGTSNLDLATPDLSKANSKLKITPVSMANNNPQSGSSTFYFYNPTTVAFGKLEFKKIWGERALEGNWRIASGNNNTFDSTALNPQNTVDPKDSLYNKIQPHYTVNYYLDQLPTAITAIDSIYKERNFANYQLGIIYKEKFKENGLAIAKLEEVVNSNPEEKLILPTLYNLYKLYQVTENNKAEAIKNKITASYPESRYAQIINNTNINAPLEDLSPEGVYNKWYKLYQQEQFVLVLENLDQLIIRFSGEEIASKFELLKANTIGKLKGLTAYKNALQVVVDNYPNSQEAKKAVLLLNDQIPYLEKMELSTADSKNWKIIFVVGSGEDKNTKALEEKIKTFNTQESFQKLHYSYDVYSEKENFVAVHGLTSKADAETIVSFLKETPRYKITQPAIVISSENYKTIQIKKNLETYLAPKK